MFRSSLKNISSVFLFILLTVSLAALADEGMWTFDNPPVKQLKERYGFSPSQEWLDHVRLSSVRFMDGGSGAFVSPNGLVLTNHHVAVGQLQKLSTSEKDYVTTGFYAAAYTDEIRCPDLEVNVLISMEDVTERVRSATSEDMKDADAFEARLAKIAEIERESENQTGLRSDVVNLYHGGEYWLYRYKKYTDVRLVFAPERQAAYFGGDLDNFTFPRYDLDMALFRVYENDTPLKVRYFLHWNSKGLKEGDLVFVSGNPGSTDRLYTYKRLEYQRDIYYPMVLNYYENYIKVLREYSARGPEQARRALIRIFGLENAKKARTGELNGLFDEKLMDKRKKEEEHFRNQVVVNDEWRMKYGNAWDTTAEAIEIMAKSAKERFYRRLIGSRMASFAKMIVRYVVEVQKPDGDRIPGYHESELDELLFYLYSPAPIYKDLEETLLAWGLKYSQRELGEEDEFVKIALDGSSPEDLARDVISNTKIYDPEFRKALIEGGEIAVSKSNDPFIVLMRKLDPISRKIEKEERDTIDSVLDAAAEKIAKARFAIYGKTINPDATFSLRLSYGTAIGFPMNGTAAPYMTTLYGLFDRSLSFGQKGDFALPQRFFDRKNELDLSTPVNFVSTCDIIGGNSGSPVKNIKGEFVGVIFDGNIDSLPGRFVYEETKNRAVAVHAAYMMEALRKLYDADVLADEIEGK